MNGSDSVLVFTLDDIETVLPDGMDLMDAVECVKSEFDCSPVFDAIQALLEAREAEDRLQLEYDECCEHGFNEDE